MDIENLVLVALKLKCINFYEYNLAKYFFAEK